MAALTITDDRRGRMSWWVTWRCVLTITDDNCRARMEGDRILYYIYYSYNIYNIISLNAILAVGGVTLMSSVICNCKGAEKVRG